jgi:hypothetical protein
MFTLFNIINIAHLYLFRHNRLPPSIQHWYYNRYTFFNILKAESAANTSGITDLLGLFLIEYTNLKIRTDSEMFHKLQTVLFIINFIIQHVNRLSNAMVNKYRYQKAFILTGMQYRYLNQLKIRSF